MKTYPYPNLTVTNRAGREVIAKEFGDDVGVRVFTRNQRRQAEALVRIHGPKEWEVVTLPSGTGFIVGRKVAAVIADAA